MHFYLVRSHVVCGHDLKDLLQYSKDNEIVSKINIFVTLEVSVNINFNLLDDLQ